MLYSLACLSDTGIVRNHNEDNFSFFGRVMPAEHQTSPILVAAVPAERPFVVGIFDGMGGEANGEDASYAAAQALNDNAELERFSHNDIQQLFSVMESAVCQERDLKRARTMGTTATIIAVANRHACAANVGDSPAMLFVDGELRTMSREHTDAETLQLLGITERKPRLTQFLGMSDDEISPSPHIVDFEIAPGNIVLIASDGLTASLSEGAICNVLASNSSAPNKVKLLRDMAVQEGGTDNITILLCEAIEPEPTSEDSIR